MLGLFSAHLRAVGPGYPVGRGRPRRYGATSILAMASHDPTERRMIASRAALIRWAQEDAVEGTRKAQAGLLRKFYNQTDPTLPEPERWKRAERLHRAHMLELSRLSARARRQRASR